ncbi:DnaA N-terminal domain-containing protein [Bacillus alkalicellulosilyticus]|uniref:DnaA N-terminal domain-containing protein n=1 Tax=Alkalihalobacterium alkalicellulosilyticum TaxID=1912214 RepID=UPI000996456D|nr:DnaA N-terminal domain-containing protein [Bacillus alkalicellulosilyticus]
MFEEENKLNTGQDKPCRYYRLVSTGVVAERQKKVGSKYGSRQKTIEVPLNAKEYYSEESILRFQLESHTKLLPDMNGQKTIINNYLLRYWGPTFHNKSGGIVAYTYIILQSYCWDKDYTWVSMDTLSKQVTCTLPTLRKYLAILEENGFIIRFWREEEDDKKNVTQGTILFKVRQTLPLLSREQYNSLPKALRLEHDRFLRKIKRESQFEFDLCHNFHDVFEQLREQVIDVVNPTGTLKEEVDKLNEYKEDYQVAQNKMSKEDILMWDKVLSKLKEKLSKPSFDTWFGQSVAYKMDDDRWFICLPTEFACSWVEQRYIPIILDIMNDNQIPVTELLCDIYLESNSTL